MIDRSDPRPANLPQVDAAKLGMVMHASYANELRGLHVPWNPTPAPHPSLLALNTELAAELGFNAEMLLGPEGLAVLAGQALPSGAHPIAQAYAGHQFGHFSPQLGDGRAVLLGEVIDAQGHRRDIAYKGSGRTPFSRAGDGKAALGPVLREYLMGEAMQALGIPTTRALAVVATGELIERERQRPGAMLVRVASSHLRVGTFQFFAARQEMEKLKRLAEYAIARHAPALIGRNDRFLGLLQTVAKSQAALMAQWMGVGFIHGVMNTDNMAISGETIDFGPCAFMDAYDPNTVFSSIDHSGRYAYANQPAIARWNLARLAEALLPLIDDGSDKANDLVCGIINDFPVLYQTQWRVVMSRKLGLANHESNAEVISVGEDFLTLLQQHGVDFTQGFRHLAEGEAGGLEHAPALMALFPRQAHEALRVWRRRWWSMVMQGGQSTAEVSKALRAANPVYIPRNHLVEDALEAATERGDLGPFEHLLGILRHPFKEQSGLMGFALPAAKELQAGYRTFCGT